MWWDDEYVIVAIRETSSFARIVAMRRWRRGGIHGPAFAALEEGSSKEWLGGFGCIIVLFAFAEDPVIDNAAR